VKTTSCGWMMTLGAPHKKNFLVVREPGDRYRTANDSERIKDATFDVESLSRSLPLAVL
jgi:hypothetical protein